MNIDVSKLEEIPQPPEHLFGLLGNLPDVEPTFPVRSYWKLKDLYGPCFKLNLERPTILVGSQELVNEACDQDRFIKVPTRALAELRPMLGDGLFSAYPGEENWWIAHRLLVPVCAYGGSFGG